MLLNSLKNFAWNLYSILYVNNQSTFKIKMRSKSFLCPHVLGEFFRSVTAAHSRLYREFITFAACVYNHIASVQPQDKVIATSHFTCKQTFDHLQIFLVKSLVLFSRMNPQTFRYLFYEGCHPSAHIGKVSNMIFLSLLLINRDYVVIHAKTEKKLFNPRGKTTSQTCFSWFSFTAQHRGQETV